MSLTMTSSNDISVSDVDDITMVTVMRTTRLMATILTYDMSLTMTSSTTPTWPMTITLTVVMVFMSATSPTIPPTPAPIGAETVETREAVTPRNGCANHQTGLHGAL